MKTTLLLLPALFLSAPLLNGQTNKPVLTDAASAKAEQALLALTRDWADAVKGRDTNKIDRIQAAEYVFTDPGGRLWTKAQAQETIKAGDLVIDSFEVSDYQARIYGDTAVVTYQVVWNGRFRGTDISGPQRMTDVFVKRDGRWQCVASQATRIP
jgi:ketosteroid isomerase-like protein